MTTPGIAVVGDIMVDIDHYCSVSRLAQEGPWPVYKIERTQQRLGGAGNVANMCHALGADVMLCGRSDIGSIIDLAPDDTEPPDFIDGTITSDRTITKTRLIVDGHYAGLRLDEHDSNPLEPGDAERIAEMVRNFKPDAIIIADHGKGVVTRELMELLAKINVPLFIDPQPTTHLARHDNTILVGHPEEMPFDSFLVDRIVKHGAKGIEWFIDKETGTLPSTCRKLVDPLGAGDQFIATLAYAFCRRLCWHQSLELANRLAGLQCEVMGCKPVGLELTVERIH